MKLERRQFLAIFGGLLAELATSRSPAVYQNGKVYINRRLGLACSAPDGWSFVQLAEMGEIQKGQLLAVDDPEENASILKSIGLPFVALSPESSHHEHQTLGIQFYLAEPPDTIDVASMLLHAAFEKPYKGNAESTFTPAMQIACRDRQIARDLLHSFRTRSMPKDLELSGCSAAEYTATFEFRHRELSAPTTVRQRSIAIQHETRFYLLRLIDTEACPFDFNPFLETLRLA